MNGKMVLNTVILILQIMKKSNLIFNNLGSSTFY